MFGIDVALSCRRSEFICLVCCWSFPFFVLLEEKWETIVGDDFWCMWSMGTLQVQYHTCEVRYPSFCSFKPCCFVHVCMLLEQAAFSSSFLGLMRHTTKKIRDIEVLGHAIPCGMRYLLFFVPARSQEYAQHVAIYAWLDFHKYKKEGAGVKISNSCATYLTVSLNMGDAQDLQMWHTACVHQNDPPGAQSSLPWFAMQCLP